MQGAKGPEHLSFDTQTKEIEFLKFVLKIYLHII